MTPGRAPTPGPGSPHAPRAAATAPCRGQKGASRHEIRDPTLGRLPFVTPAILAPESVTGFARAAEAGGFDAIGFTDHPARSGAWGRERRQARHHPPALRTTRVIDL